MSGILSVGGGGNVGASGGFYSYSIDQSLRFNDGDSAHLTFTPSSAGNRKTWTWSCWVKRSSIDSTNAYILFDASTSDTAAALIEFGKSTEGDNSLNVVSYQGSHNIRLRTSMRFRDVSSWYHIVVAMDTSQATDSDRVNIYVNGTLQTDFQIETYPAQNHEPYFNSTNQHHISKWWDSRRFFDGYMAEVNFIDGTALDATSFGETSNGVWVPKAYSGSYGTNGFYLSFADSGAIGDDLSGNTNDFTANNLAASDVVPDTPTNNFATLNVLQDVGNATFSEGNLRLAGSGADYDRAFSTIGVTSGKWYAEFRYISGDNRGFFGVIREDSYTQVAGDYIGELANQYGLDFRARSYSNNVELFDTTDFSIGDIGLLCFDIDNGKIWFGRRDISGATTIWYDSAGANNGDPSAGTNPTYTGTFTGHTWFIGCSDFNTTTVHANFGADGSFSGGITSGGLSDDNGIGDFNYIEDGFLALCTANLPEPAIGPNSTEQADDYFTTVLSTGDGTNATISGFGFQPDFLWHKARSVANGHWIMDSIRVDGSGDSLPLRVDSTNAEGSTVTVTLNSDGYVHLNGSSNNFYGSGQTYVDWAWKAGGTAVSNTDGSITSSVSASQDAGFAVGTYTGNATAGATIGHSLGAIPEMVIVKRRSNARDWAVYHKDQSATPTNAYMLLNNSAAVATGNTAWNNGTFTSDVFTIGSHELVNFSGDSYVFYAFKGIEGHSKCGKYVGNGSTDGTFVYTGFRPAFVMWKNASAATVWVIFDAVRETYNYLDAQLRPNESSAENSAGASYSMDFLSNGFKLRSSDSNFNGSGNTIIYLAFAESPFKYANAR